MLENNVKFEKVSFSYKNHLVLEDLNLDIEGDQFISVIGVNGAGKSTLLKIIMGLLVPQKGSVSVAGLSPRSFDIKYIRGSSLQEIDFPRTERVEEIVDFICHQYPNALEPEALINDFKLTKFRKKQCGQLSGGMKRRVALACAFAGSPKVVLLDEPTTGLDSATRKEILRHIKNYQKKHKALVLMISHHPDEVIEFMDYFFLVKNGRVQKLSPEKMNELTRLKKIEFQSNMKIDTAKALKSKQEGTHYQIIVDDSDAYIKSLCEQKVSFQNLRVGQLDADELIREVL